MTIISSLNFTQLQSVDEIVLAAIPALQTFTLLQTLNNLTTISIQNTEIQELQGFSLETVQHITIMNNNYLNSINL